MNIESYVFLICFVALGIVSLITVGKLIAVEKELERKKQVIKALQKELRVLNLQVGALKELANIEEGTSTNV